MVLDSNIIVAAGLVFEKFEPNDTVHHMSLGEDNVRVSIDKVYHPDTNLPIPVANADMMTVKDALGSQVAWPKKHVLLDVEVMHIIFSECLNILDNYSFGFKIFIC